MRARLENLAGRRLTQDGVLILTARNHRTQERNRQDARERLIELIRQAAAPPSYRKPTNPRQAAGGAGWTPSSGDPPPKNCAADLAGGLGRPRNRNAGSAKGF